MGLGGGSPAKTRGKRETEGGWQRQGAGEREGRGLEEIRREGRMGKTGMKQSSPAPGGGAVLRASAHGLKGLRCGLSRGHLPGLQARSPALWQSISDVSFSTSTK